MPGVNLFVKTSEVKECIAEMTKVFSAHYPETKGKTLFVKFPSVFSKLFQVPSRPDLLYRGKLFYLQLELFCLQLSFFAYSPLRRSLEALSHCKQESSNCKQKS